VDSIDEMIGLAAIFAPTDGLVVVGKSWEGKYEAGSNVWPGAVLLRLPDLSEMQVVAWVHEVDSPLLVQDQMAKVTMDAHPTTPANSVVTKIAELAIARGENRVKHMRVVLEMDETTEKMKPGMTVNVDLLVSRFEDAVLVPSGAVSRQGGQPVVWTQGFGGWSAQPVTVLGRDGEQVAVEGIDAGLTVAIGDPT
jgi:HlyD family secretion protein